MQTKPKWMEESRRVRDQLHEHKDDFPEEFLAAMPTPGVPPAPVEAYGRHESVAQHLYQWDPSTTKALSKPLLSSLLPSTSPIPARSVTALSPIGSATKLRCFWEVVDILSGFAFVSEKLQA